MTNDNDNPAEDDNIDDMEDETPQRTIDTAHLIRMFINRQVGKRITFTAEEFRAAEHLAAGMVFEDDGGLELFFVTPMRLLSLS